MQAWILMRTPTWDPSRIDDLPTEKHLYMPVSRLCGTILRLKRPETP